MRHFAFADMRSPRHGCIYVGGYPCGNVAGIMKLRCLRCSELRANPVVFELVVTDYNVPGISGLDVARAACEIPAGLPVVVASGLIDENLRAQAGGRRP